MSNQNVDSRNQRIREARNQKNILKKEDEKYILLQNEIKELKEIVKNLEIKISDIYNKHTPKTKEKIKK